jgi:hypothetical protein
MNRSLTSLADYYRLCNMSTRIPIYCESFLWKDFFEEVYRQIGPASLKNRVDAEEDKKSEEASRWLSLSKWASFFSIIKNAQLAPLNCASRTRRDLTGQAHSPVQRAGLSERFTIINFLTFGRFPAACPSSVAGNLSSASTSSGQAAIACYGRRGAEDGLQGSSKVEVKCK